MQINVFEYEKKCLSIIVYVVSVYLYINGLSGDEWCLQPTVNLLNLISTELDLD